MTRTSSSFFLPSIFSCWGYIKSEQFCAFKSEQVACVQKWMMLRKERGAAFLLRWSATEPERSEGAVERKRSKNAARELLPLRDDASTKRARSVRPAC